MFNHQQSKRDEPTPTQKPMHHHADKAPDALKKHEEEGRQEQLLDEGLEESFPASDPVSVKRIT